MARVLHAAERNTGIGGDHLVDENHAGLEVTNEAFLFGGNVGPDAGAEAETAVVREADSFVDVFHAEVRGDRAEELLAVGGRIFRDVGDDGWLKEVSSMLDGLAAGQKFSAGVEGLLQIAFQVGDDAGSREWSEFGG